MAAHRRHPAGRRRACRGDGRGRLPAAIPGVWCRVTGRVPVVLGLARLEAFLLVRSLLVLAGLLAGGIVTWVIFGPAEPLWWNAAWQIGFGELILGLAVLVAAQLAAGRARRDGLGRVVRELSGHGQQPQRRPGSRPGGRGGPWAG